jgi:hypothetical protein
MFVDKKINARLAAIEDDKDMCKSTHFLVNIASLVGSK